MQIANEHGVQILEQASESRIRHLPMWEGAQIFLIVAQHRSFRAAATALGCSLNTVRNHFFKFQEKLGVCLITRGAFGVRLTAEGERVLTAAKRMELAYFDLIRTRDSTAATIAGEVKLAITEGLGTFWVGPRLIEFQKAFPKLLIDMHCAMSPPDILRLEADVGVQITMPNVKDLKVVKIGRLHVMPFASKSYVEEHGRPRDLTELLTHRIVIQESDQVESERSLSVLFPSNPRAAVAIRTNVSSAHYWAIAKGGGIGMLPTYANAMGAPVVPVDIWIDEKRRLRVQYDIWLTYHPDGHNIVRVRRLIEWLRDAFTPKRYPWFSDRFVHPNELPRAVGGLPLVNLFAGFSSMDYAA